MRSRADVIYRATNLSLGYGTHVVLRGVNLVVRPGQFWFFLGPNGSGKTTLLRGLLGLLKARAGSLEMPALSRSAKQIGFVPQRCEINSTLPITVREFVSLGLVGTQGNKEVRRAHLEWALEQLGLRGLARQSYWTLSGGQQQRALVARALVRRPNVLILDEPTGNLDLSAADAVLQTLAAIQHEAACLLVTHNLSLAERHATHIGLVTDGSVIAGARAEMLTESNLDRVYGRGRRIHMHVAPEGSSTAPPSRQPLSKDG